MLRDPLARLTTALINLQRPNEGLQIAEERPIPDEEALPRLDHHELREADAAALEAGRLRARRQHQDARHRARRVHRARRSARASCGTASTPSRRPTAPGCASPGPGPYITPDIDDVGFMSISIKLMGVPGPKLMDEEKFTQDMFGVSTPTFVTPDTKANAQLQIESLKNAQIFYFLNLHRSHVLDLIMQALWIKTQSSPFEAPYFSCVPYLLGEGQAMQYSVWPKSTSGRRSRGCRFARRTTICATRWSQSLAAGRRRVRRPAAAADRSAPDADREQRRALARAAVAARLGGDAAPAAADVQLAGADGVRQAPLVQPVALHPRASSARQSEPRPASDVLRAVEAAAHDERRAALRADGRRGVR